MRSWLRLTFVSANTPAMATAESCRGVMQLFDPMRDTRGHKDVPCALGYRFYVRDALLQMHTTMRSQDLWRGLCYDIFVATILQELMAGWLDVGVGDYHHHVDSLHLYLDDVPRAARLPECVEPGATMPSLGVAWKHFDLLLRSVVAGEPVVHRGWAEFATVMASYRAWKGGERSEARSILATGAGPLASALERWYRRIERTPVGRTAGGPAR